MRRYHKLPLFLHHLFTLKRNLKLEPSRLYALQVKKIRVLVKYAYENVPFYHKLLIESNIKPTDIKTLKDMEKIPVTTRKVAREHFSEMLSRRVNKARCTTHTTSGSTGLPLTVVIDDYGKDFRSAVSLRQFLECGGRLRDRQVQLRPAASSALSETRGKPIYERIGLLRMESIPLRDISDSLVSFLKAYEPDIMVGNPSTYQLLCEIMRGEINPRIVFSTGEILSKECRDLIISAFGAQVIDSYGCTEAWDVAWECPDECNGYHINADAVLVEFLKDGETAVAGEEGEIIVTNLFNYAMPFIRYAVGDVGVKVDDSPICGRTLPLMDVIKGRSGDFIVLPDRRKLSPAFIDLNPFNNVREFRIVQEREDLLEIWLKEDLDRGVEFEHRRDQCVSALRRAVGKGVQIRVRVMKEIPRDNSGKLRRIISKVSE